MSNLTENLREWRKARNITKADYLVFIGNVLEELLEPIYTKDYVADCKNEILEQYFNSIDYQRLNKLDVLDAIKDIKVFSVNETENMGYCDKKTDTEVFKEINSRKQDPKQYLEWQESTPYGKWKKWAEQPKEELYTANYEECKL